MNIKKIILTVFLLNTLVAYSQIANPKIFKKDVVTSHIEKIERDGKSTKVDMLYVAPAKYVKGGWVCFSKDSYIEDTSTGQKYVFVHSEIMPICPKKIQFEYEGQILRFSIYFESLPMSTKIIDLIEDRTNGGFNFFGVNLLESDENSFDLENVVNSQKRNSPISEELESAFKNRDWVNVIKKGTYEMNNAPNNPFPVMLVAVGFYNIGDYENSVNYYIKFVEMIGEENVDASTDGAIGTCFLQIGQYQNAIKFYSKAILKGNIESYSGRATAYAKNGDLDLSIKDFKTSETLNLQRNDSNFYHWFGYAYMEKGSSMGKQDINGKVYFGKAIENFKKDLRINTNSTASYNFMAMCYYLSGDPESAKYYWDKSLSINPNQPGINEFKNRIKIEENYRNQNEIKLRKEYGVYMIPATLNNSVRVEFVFDSGASEVLLSPEVVMVLINNNTISHGDVIESGYFKIADGSIVEMSRFIIKEIQVGNKKVYNIPCSVSNEFGGDMLLGQSVLEKLGNFTFDYNNGVLIINN